MTQKVQKNNQKVEKKYEYNKSTQISASFSTSLM